MTPEASAAPGAPAARRVLFVAYLFPPQGGGGVQRTVKFCKYLPEHGWQPAVLAGPAAGRVQDPSLAAEVPPGTRVERVRGAALPGWLPWRGRRWLARWVLTVDEHAGWLPFAARRARRWLGEQRFQALYSTSAPYTDHLVALRLARRSRLPWVADFRDPWLGNESASFPTPLHRALCARLERDVVLAAGRVLVVSEPMRQSFLARYPALAPERVVTLPNGFDPADFEGVAPAPRDRRLTLVYTGTLYGTRTIRPFLAALRRLLDEGAVPRDDIAVRLVGNTGQEAAALVADWDLAGVVELAGYQPHRQAIAHQKAADALLLIVGGGPGSDVVLTAKLFEYLATGKPILALVPPGAARDLLAEASGARLAPPGDTPLICDALRGLYTDGQAGRLDVPPDPTVVARYNRRVQAGQLAAILDELARQEVP